MDYLVQPRGPGTGWVFRMVTPPELEGQRNPWTGRTFGSEIKRGLGPRHPTEARKRRDIALGQIRALTLQATSEEDDFGLTSALEWRQMISEDDWSSPGLVDTF